MTSISPLPDDGDIDSDVVLTKSRASDASDGSTPIKVPRSHHGVNIATEESSPSTVSLSLGSALFPFPSPLPMTSESSDIVRLNIGGVPYMTTKATLLSRGQNFFGPLLDGHFAQLRDASGAYFIDRNGRMFAPLLDYLRQGVLMLPSDVKIEILWEEAKFYGIDLLPGLCGDLKEGLYTSSNWILFFERDPDLPWIFGITGVEERSKRVFFQETSVVRDGAIVWRDYLIHVKHGKLYIFTKSVFKSKTQLYYRAPKSERFPNLLAEGLVSDQKLPAPQGDNREDRGREGGREGAFGGIGGGGGGGGGGVGGAGGTGGGGGGGGNDRASTSSATQELSEVVLAFSQSSQGITCKSFFSVGQDLPKPAQFWSKVIVLCRSLLIMTWNEERWLLYLHSDLAFFTFNHPFMEFSDSFHLISHK